MKSGIPSKIASGAGIIVLGLLMVWGWSFYQSFKAFERGAYFARSGDMVNAITYFDRSIRWYTPWNPYVYRSSEKIWDIGIAYEKKGDSHGALMAFRTIRQGFQGIRSFYGPGEEWIEKCDAKILEIINARERESRYNQSQAIKESRKVPGPRRGWSLLVVVAFLGWIGSAIGFIRFGLTGGSQLKIRWRRTALWGLSLGLFFALWIIGMIKA